MKQLRREDLSLHHYIRHFVLADYIETDYNVSLTYLSDISDPSANSYVYEAATTVEPSPTSKGRGWVYSDVSPYRTEQSSAVIVYDDQSTVISGSNYIVDYIDGRVIFSNNSLNPTTITYKWYYVALLNDWNDITAPDVPAVVVDINRSTKAGFQLGGGKMPNRLSYLHIFALNQAERDDIAELLYDGIYLRNCGFQEFNKGTMIDWDGTYNDNYVFSTVSGSSPLYFERVRSRNVTPPLFGIPNRDVTMLSDLNKYRHRVDFDMFHYEEGYDASY